METVEAAVAFDVSLESENCEYELYESLKYNNFAVVTDHSVPLDLLEDVYVQWGKFFNSNLKNDWLHCDDIDEGYVPENVEVAVGYETADKKEHYQSHVGGMIHGFNY